jgi:FdhD protein
MAERVSPASIIKVEQGVSTPKQDLVVKEEPLEIRLGYGPETSRKQSTISVTMRTPGHDEQLCLGFLYNEGMIETRDQVMSAKYCSNVALEDGGDNIMRIELKPDLNFRPADFSRNFYTNSSCGVCGKATIDHILDNCTIATDPGLAVKKKVILSLPDKLKEIQDVFKYTGGLHACGLFDLEGNLGLHKEDVGRHNALDKLIGSLLLHNSLPASDKILMLSGRISFELVQKAIRAGILVVVAVGAPSSLAIELADRFGISLIGFLKEHSFNIYTHPHRIID